MSESGDGEQTDSEDGWPPRFGDGALKYAAQVLVALFLVVGVGLWLAMNREFGGDDAADRGSAYVLFVLGVLFLLLGVLFALVEAKRPPPAAPTVQVMLVDPQADTRKLLNDATFAKALSDVAPSVGGGGDLLGSVIDKISGRAVSRVLFAMSFVLNVFAAAGLGFIELSASIGDGDPTPAPTTGVPANGS